MHPDQLPPALQSVIARVVKAERRRADRQAEHARREVYAALGEVLVKSLPGAFMKAAEHAPAGGVKVQGKEYTGGQFIPADVMANATAEEKAAVAGGGKADETGPAESDPDRKAITDRLAGFNNVGDLELEHDELREDLFQRLQATDDDEESDRLADLIQFSDEELERLKEEIESQDDDEPEDEEEPEGTAREELAAGDWHPVHADEWLSEDAWPHEDPTEAAWDFRKSQAANRARFEKQLTAQAAADAEQVQDFAAQAEARVKDLTGDETDAATVREFAKDATAAIEDATAEYTTAAADYYDADKEAYKAEQKVPEGAMSTADIDALESAADRYREMRLKAAEKLTPADRDAEVERIEQQHEKRLSGVDRRAAKMKDKADQLAAVRDQQAARYESARSAYATTIREQVAAIQSAVADIANGFTGRTAKSITRVAKSLGLSLQLEDLKEGVRRGVAADVWAWNDMLASVGDELGLERVTKADRSHLVRKVIRNRLGRRQVVWVKPQESDKADRGVPVGEDGKPVEKPAPVAKTREQLAESRSVLAAAVNNPDRLNPEQVRQLADHIDAITKEEAKGLLKQLGQKVSGDQMAVAGRLLEAIRAGRGAGGVGEALKRAGNKTSGQYGAWGQAAGGGERPVSRDSLPKRGVGPGEVSNDAGSVEQPRDKYGVSQLESGRFVTPHTPGTYATERDAVTAARAALGDYATRKPSAPKANPMAGEIAAEASAAAREQQASGKIKTTGGPSKMDDAIEAKLKDAVSSVLADIADRGMSPDDALAAHAERSTFGPKTREELRRRVLEQVAEPDQSTPTISPAEFDRRMSTIDPRDSGRVEVPEPVRPLEPDDADRERYDAARERLDRMRGWAADKPNDLRAEEQVRRAEGRLREVVGQEEEPRREPTPRPVPPADHRARAATHRQTADQLEAVARDAAAEGDREAARLNAVAARASREAANTHDEVATVKRLQEREREQLTADQERRRKEAEAKVSDTAGRLEEARAKEEAAKRRVEELRAGRTEPTPKPAAPRQNFQTLRRQAAEGMAAGAAAMQAPHDGSGLPDIPLYASLSADQRADLDAQRRAAKTRQEARGVELLASQLASEAASARRSDAAKGKK